MNLLLRLVGFSFLCYSLGLGATDQSDPSLLAKIKAENILIDPKKSLQFLAELEPELSESGEEQIWFHLRRAQAQEQLLLLDEMMTTLAFFQQKAPESGPAAAVYHLLLGMHARKSDLLVKAKAHLQLASALAETHAQTRVYIHSTAELANTHSMLNENALALSVNNLAYQTAVSKNSAFGQAASHLVFGNIYHEIALFEESVVFYKLGIEAFESLGYRMFYVTALFDLATTYRYQKKYDDAIFYFQKYQREIESAAVDKSLYYVYYGLGITLAEKGDCEKAIQQIDLGLSIRGPKGWDAEMFKRKSTCHSSMGQLLEAEQALDEASALFLALPDLKGSRWEIELIKVESNLAYASGDFKRAMDLWRDYDAKKTALDRKAYTKRFLDVRTSMDGQKKDLEIQLLREQNEVQRLKSAELAHQGWNRLLTIAGIVALSLVLVFALVFRISGRRLSKSS